MGRVHKQRLLQMLIFMNRKSTTVNSALRTFQAARKEYTVSLASVAEL